MGMTLYEVANRVLGPGGHSEMESRLRLIKDEGERTEVMREYLGEIVHRLDIMEERTPEELAEYYEALEPPRITR